jgi:ABC-type Na+ efflux pump permease subunit
MRIRRIFLLLIVLILAALIAACTRAVTQGPGQPTATAVVRTGSPPTQKPQEGELPTSSPDEGTIESAIVEPTEEVQKPELKTGLVATDPDSVNLSSGKPTLVEFFAFW